MEIFSMRLKKVRLANNLTQQDLADKLMYLASILRRECVEYKHNKNKQTNRKSRQ